MSEALVETQPRAWEAALDAIRSDSAALSFSGIDGRTSALERYRITTANREKPGRYWKLDLDRLEPTVEPTSQPAVVQFSGGTAPGVVFHDLAGAVKQDPSAFHGTFGRALAHAPGKYAALTQALHRGGAFIHIPADVCVDEPIVITYRAEEGTASFPYTLVVADQGSSATIVERHESPGANLFVAGVSEIFAHDSASVTHAVVQRLPEDAITFFTRAAVLERNAAISWCAADLGAHISGSTIFSAVEGLGADSHIAALFFPCGEQHVDFITTTDHLAGQSQSRTVIKSAATGSGQARYLGNIRIAATMHGCDASLKDDALLLSAQAHIDSVPALEIAANDVKAFHGATVGALDDLVIFYMMSRGLDRSTAQRMITLGFFEPALDHFPTNALREELRNELAQKIAAT